MTHFIKRFLNSFIFIHMAQLDSLYNNQLESLLKTTNDISHHTYAWDGFVSSSITALTIAAALATLAGLGLIIKEVKRRHYTKAKQALLIKDLVRHLFVNAAIMEALQIKSCGQWDKVHPAKGVFSRFAVLDSDLLLDDIQLSNKDFLRSHSLKVFLRNYNIAAVVAEDSFSNPNIALDEKTAIIEELWERTNRSVKELTEVGIIAHLLPGTRENQEEGKQAVSSFIKEYYEKENSKINPRELIGLPTRNGSHTLFDCNGFNLKEEFDMAIVRRTKDIRVIDF